MGAHHVVDHHNLSEEVAKTYADIMAVHGQVAAIDEPEGLDILPLKVKSQTWHWELMFTRPLFDPTSTAQRDLLEEAARLFDSGVLKPTLTRSLSPLTPDTLPEAHRLLEGSTMIGKAVVAAAGYGQSTERSPA